MMNFSGKQIIFYGAGDWIQHYHKSLKILHGVKPVCFSDGNPEKWNTQIAFEGGGEYPIYPLTEAIKKYPEALIYVSLGIPLQYEVMHELVEKHGIAPEWIVGYCETEYRLGCKHMETTILYDTYKTSKVVRFCSEAKVGRTNLHAESVSYVTGESVAEDIEALSDLRNKLIEAINAGKETDCDGCRFLREAYWPKKRRISEIRLCGGGSCQFNCLHCAKESDRNELPLNISGITRFFAREFKSNLYLLPTIFFAHGEPTIQKGFTQCLKEIIDSPIRALIATNGEFYNPLIAQLLEKREAVVSISIDSGTAGTFRRIKGVDAFDKVRDTIIRYGKTRGNMRAKYIFFEGINDGKEDIDGFVRIATEAGLTSVIMSADFTMVQIPKQDTHFRQLCYFADSFLLNNMKIFLEVSYLGYDLANKLAKSFSNCIFDDNA